MPQPTSFEDPNALLKLLALVSSFRARIGQGVRDTGDQFLRGAQVLDQGMRFIGDNPREFLPIIGDIKAVTEDAPEAFGSGHPGIGLLALLSGILPGIPAPSRGAKLLIAEDTFIKEQIPRAHFTATNALGESVPGTIEATLNPKTGSLIVDIPATAKGQGMLNVSGIRDIGKQLIEKFEAAGHEIKELTGFRATGARASGGLESLDVDQHLTIPRSFFISEAP